MVDTGDRLRKSYILYSMHWVLGVRNAKHVSTQPFLI